MRTRSEAMVSHRRHGRVRAIRPSHLATITATSPRRRRSRRDPAGRTAGARGAGRVASVRRVCAVAGSGMCCSCPSGLRAVPGWGVLLVSVGFARGGGVGPVARVRRACGERDVLLVSVEFARGGEQDVLLCPSSCARWPGEQDVLPASVQLAGSGMCCLRPSSCGAAAGAGCVACVRRVGGARRRVPRCWVRTTADERRDGRRVGTGVRFVAGLPAE